MTDPAPRHGLEIMEGISDIWERRTPRDFRPLVEKITAGDADKPEHWQMYDSPGQPWPVAERLVNELFIGDDKRLRTYWRGTWWSWATTHWVAVEEADIREPLWRRLSEVKYATGKKDETRPWSPTRAKISDVMEPLELKLRRPTASEAPAWMDNAHHPPVENIIPMANGLLDMTTKQLHPHTPAYFNTWSLDFNFDARATSPVWDKFLDQVFAHDKNGALMLQEFAGYLVSGRTSRQKALFISGPPSGGKGTISRALTTLMGAGNVASLDLHTLGSEFGVADLIAKPAALIADGQDAAAQQSSRAVERLLNIIGEDSVSINRKNQDYWVGKLPTRFMWFGNRVPRLLDSSKAIGRRFMMARLVMSLGEGERDEKLGDKINAEMPGVLNWALRGLERLDEQGDFTRPDTMDEMHELLTTLASPISTFIEDTYEVTGGDEDFILMSQVSADHRTWCEESGSNHLRRDTLAQQLQSADPAIRYLNTPRGDDRKARKIFGIQHKKKDPGQWQFSP